jgi:hypothetical protein
MNKRLSIFIVCLLLFSSLLTAYHHHDGGQDHPNCSICAVANHYTSALLSHPEFIPPSQLITTVEFPPFIQHSISITRYSFHSRAPPV